MTIPTEAEVEALRVIRNKLSVKHFHAVADAADARYAAVGAQVAYYDADAEWAEACVAHEATR
jgi:hypothetical protein